MGLQKLNDVLNLINGVGKISTDNPELLFGKAMPSSTVYRATAVQSTILKLGSSKSALPYNAAAIQLLIREMIDVYMPKEWWYIYRLRMSILLASLAC